MTRPFLLTLALTMIVGACSSGPTVTSSQAPSTPAATQLATASLSVPSPTTAPASATASPSVAPTESASASASPSPSAASSPTSLPTQSPSASPSAPIGPIVELIAGGGTQAPAPGVGALEVALQRPSGLAVGSTGTLLGDQLWIVDANLGQLIRLSPDYASIEYVVGGMSNPHGLTTTAARGPSTVYAADTSGYRVVTPGDGGLERVGGREFRSGFRGDGGPALRALLWLPYDVAGDSAGGLYIADTGNERIRFIDPATGDIDTIAGTGIAGFSGDGGPAIDAQLNNVQAVAVTLDGVLFIADMDNGRLRRLDPATGIIDTVAGTGTGAVTFDAALTGLQTPITRISALAVDSAGNAYFPVFWGDIGPTIMRLEPSGTMTRVVGGGRSSLAGVAALDFALTDVLGLAIGSDGSLLICGSDGKVYRVSGVAPVS